MKNNWLNNLNKKKSKTSHSKLISNNYINLNTPIYNNKDYKNNIRCYNETPPTIDGGIRINYYNAGRSLLL